MGAEIVDNAEATEEVLDVLLKHLPYSLPTLRRLQFLRVSQTPESHVLSTFNAESPGRDFLVAFLDFSKGPETEMWIYSSIENRDTPGDEAVCEPQILELFKHVREIEKGYQSQRKTPGIVLAGALNSVIVRILEKHSMVNFKTEEHFKFIFSANELPTERPLPHDLVYSTVRPADIPFVLSRTAIPYKAASMKLLPSAAIAKRDKTPVAWAFLGLDGSIKALQCEEEYRGRGLAKAVTLRLLRGRTTDFGDDGFAHAGVAVTNLQSQGVMQSLKGTRRWKLYWTWVSIA